MIDKNDNRQEMPAENKERSRKAESDTQNTVLLYLHDLVTLLTGILLVLLLLLRIVIVSGPSMNDTLVDGDYLLLLNNVFYSNPKQGDIIVASKDSFKEGEPIIKRVIATEGQTVDIDFSEGVVYVDGTPLEEPYTLTPTNLEEGITFPIEVEEDCIFVMGDNRNKSKDSRNPEIGLIDTREVLGKAVFLMFPGSNGGFSKRDFSRIGVL